MVNVQLIVTSLQPQLFAFMLSWLKGQLDGALSSAKYTNQKPHESSQ